MAVIALSVVGASAAGDLDGYARTDQGIILEQLAARGHRLVDVSSADATHYVAFDHNSRSLAAIATRIPVARRQLVVYEPRVVIPANYQRRVQRKYGSILALTPAALRDEEARPLPWPQRDWRAKPAASGSRIVGSTAMINANKISLVRGSLYGLRRRVIHAFAAAGLPLTLVGSNWSRHGAILAKENMRSLAYALLNGERPDFAELAGALPLDGSVDSRGIVDDKESVLIQSEFAVVIENSATYVSEKLFDAMFAGCVPLYVGPPLRTFGIPDDVAVQLGARASASDFVQTIRSLSAARKAAVLGAAREWLAMDSTYETWAMPYAMDRIAAKIDENIRKADSA